MHVLFYYGNGKKRRHARSLWNPESRERHGRALTDALASAHQALMRELRGFDIPGFFLESA
jgi:hypothetical protein